jgi:hypothetical protein
MILVQNKKLIGDLNVLDAVLREIIKIFNDMLRIPITEYRASVGIFILLAVNDIDHTKRTFHRTA